MVPTLRRLPRLGWQSSNLCQSNGLGLRIDQGVRLASNGTGKTLRFEKACPIILRFENPRAPRPHLFRGTIRFRTSSRSGFCMNLWTFSSSGWSKSPRAGRTSRFPFPWRGIGNSTVCRSGFAASTFVTATALNKAKKNWSLVRSCTFKERNGNFWFEMSFVPGGEESDQDVETFEGVILPLRASVFFVGWNDHRGRSLFVNCDFAREFEGLPFWDSEQHAARQ